MGTNVHLTPELGWFAHCCVAEGRYNNVSEVVRAALRVLQEQEAARAAFIRSLEDSAEEGERDEFVAADAVERNVRAAIDEARPRRA